MATPMKLPGYSILKTLAREREMSLGEVIPLLSKKFGDHRDYHVLASLINSGYVSTDLQTRQPFESSGLEDMSESLYMMEFGEGQFEYRGRPVVNGADFRKELTLVCTAKTDIYFAEQRAQRSERLWSVFLGVLIAVVSAGVTSYLTDALKSRDARHAAATKAPGIAPFINNLTRPPDARPVGPTTFVKTVVPPKEQGVVMKAPDVGYAETLYLQDGNQSVTSIEVTKPSALPDGLKPVFAGARFGETRRVWNCPRPAQCEVSEYTFFRPSSN